MSVKNETVAEVIRTIGRVGGDAIPSKFQTEKAVAVGLMNLVAGLLEGGDSPEQVIAKLRPAPSLRDTIEEDRAREDEEIARKPSRNDEPTGRG